MLNIIYNLVQIVRSRNCRYYLRVSIFQFEYFVLCSFVWYSMVFCNRFVFECFLSNIWIVLKTRAYLGCWFLYIDMFYINFRSCETFKVINSVTRTLLIETLSKFRIFKYWFALYIHMYVLGWHKLKWCVYTD